MPLIPTSPKAPFTSFSQEARFLSKILPPNASGCSLWAGQVSDNAGLFSMSGKDCRAHRVAYALFHGPIPPSFQVRQTCNNKLCLSPSHLVLVDPETLKKSPKKVFAKSGSGHHSSKLTDEDILSIRERAQTERQVDLAMLFNVSQATICNIVNHRTWRNITPPAGQEPQQLP